jgi:hypothetical protein
MDDLNKEFKNTASKFTYSLGFGLPTFDWIELKKVRKQEFINYKKSVNDAYRMDGIEPENDNVLYKYWLPKEIIEANLWKSDIIEKGFTDLYEKDLIQIDHYISFLEQERDNLTKSKPKKQKTKISYIWQNNPDKELPELHKLMRDKYKLIASETTFEQFKAVFTGQPIDDSFEPLKWKESNRLLAYFLDSAFSGQNWQSIAGKGNLFFNLKGKLIKANDLSVAKKEYTDNGKPKGYEKIDMILSTIKKHSEH